MEVIETWRIAVGLTEFTILGHSFGGYMAANYYLKYPDIINEVFLLSPMISTKMATPENNNNNLLVRSNSNTTASSKNDNNTNPTTADQQQQ